jgi:tetratricopeptide (TPR) repeat protein
VTNFKIACLILCLSSSALAGDYDAQIWRYKQIVKKDPNNLDATYQLANYLAWDGRFDEALANFQDILSKDSNRKDAEIGIARVYAWRGDQEIAKQKYEELLAKYPKSFEVYQGLGDLALWKNDFEKSIGYYKKALEFNSEDIVTLKGLGRAYLGRGDRRMANEFFTRAQILELKKKPLLLIIAIVAGSALPFLILGLFIRSRFRKQKKLRLRMELKVMRYALAIYQQKTGAWPLAIEELLKETWRPPGTTADQPILEGIRREDHGFLIDPFENRYWYNPDTGGLYSTTKGCEKW